MEGRGKGLKRVLLPPKALKRKVVKKKKLVTETVSFLMFLFICNMCE